MVWYGMVWHGRISMPPPPTTPLSLAPQQHRPTGTQHVQAISKEDQIKLEPSVATGCVDGSTPMVWYDMAWYGMVWYGMVWYGGEGMVPLLLRRLPDLLDGIVQSRGPAHTLVVRCPCNAQTSSNQNMAPYKTADL